MKGKTQSVMFESIPGDALVIQENTLKAHDVPQAIEPQTLGTIVEQKSVIVENDENKEVICSYPERELFGFCVDELLYQIGICESRLKPVCNSGGCGFGRGPYQLIQTTQELCQTELNKLIDPFSGPDSVECALYLYKKNGYKDWGTAETVGIWGSYDCFKKFIK